MIVNFTNVSCRPSRKGGEIAHNFAEELGEFLYQYARTRKDAKLADLIGDSVGEIELTDEQVKAVAECVKQSPFLFWAKDAILGVLGVEME